MLYRPSCTDCAACLSARIRVADFTPKTQPPPYREAQRGPVAAGPVGPGRRKGNTSFSAATSTRAMPMAEWRIWTCSEFAAMIEETPVRTRVIEYRDENTKGPDGEAPLAAVCLTDNPR